MNDFEAKGKFDRVVSIEMFEHMRNYEKLLARVSAWLKKEGKLFVHIFSHEKVAYPFEDNDDADWMAREFFSGGQMPSHRLLMSFPNQMKIAKDWRVSGTHYEKTSLAWLRKMDSNQAEVLELFKTTYGEKDATAWLQRWRICLLYTSPLFGFNKGSEWGVSHYIFEKPQ